MGIYFNGEKTHRYPFLEVKVKDQSGKEEDLNDPDNEEGQDYSGEEPENTNNDEAPPSDDNTVVDTQTDTSEDNDDVADYSNDEGEEPPTDGDPDEPTNDDNPNGEEPEDYSQNPEDTGTEDNSDQTITDNDEPADYSNNSDGSEDNDTPIGDGSDEPEDDGDSQNEPTTDGDGTNELENIEKDLFSNLTPEQVEIKHRELKKQYLALYDATGHIVDRINNSPKSSKTFEVINFIIDQVSKLRSYLLDYLVDNYSNHTYFENLLNYNQYLGIMSGINQLLDQLPAENE